MNLTEIEAKTKWCPFSRTAAFTDRGQLMPVTTNRDPRPDVSISCNCIASECMAWKWQNWYITEPPNHISPEKLGYCGLAKG